MGCAAFKDPTNRVNGPALMRSMSSDIRDYLDSAGSPSKKDQKNAAELLYRMSQGGDLVRHRIIQEGGIEASVVLYESKCSDVKVKILHALCEFCRSETCQGKVIDNDAWIPLIRGISSGQHELFELALRAMCSLVKSEYGNTKLVLEGAVPLLLKTLSEDDKEVGRDFDLNILQVLLSMAALDQNLQRMLEDGILEPLFNIMHSSLRCAEQKALSMEIISRLCRCDEGCNRLPDVNGLTGLQSIAALASFADDHVAMHAAMTVGLLARSTTAAHRLVQYGILQPLERMLRSKNPDVVLRALQALSALTCCTDAQVALSKAALMRRILRLCQEDVDDVALGSISLLELIAVYQASLSALAAVGALEVLRRIADSGPTPARQRAALRLADTLEGALDGRRALAVRRAADRFKDSVAPNATNGGGRRVPMEDGRSMEDFMSLMCSYELPYETNGMFGVSLASCSSPSPDQQG